MPQHSTEHPFSTPDAYNTVLNIPYVTLRPPHSNTHFLQYSTIPSAWHQQPHGTAHLLGVLKIPPTVLHILNRAQRGLFIVVIILHSPSRCLPHQYPYTSLRYCTLVTPSVNLRCFQSTKPKMTYIVGETR